MLKIIRYRLPHKKSRLQGFGRTGSSKADSGREGKRQFFNDDWRKDVHRQEGGRNRNPCCLCRVKSSKSNGQIGEFHGFSLNASYDSFYQTYKLTIKRQCSYQIEIGKDVLGNLQRISNALTGIEKRLTEAEQKMENLLSQLATAQEEVEKPFPKEAELTEKMERLAELNSLLNMDEKGTSEALGMGEDIAAVADSPRCAVTMAGRVSELPIPQTVYRNRQCLES